MTGKSKKGAAVSKGKKVGAGAAPKPKQESDEATKVIEVSEDQKAAEEVKAAPPPAASTQDVDNSEEAGQSKPTEAEAEAIAEQLLAEARKPLKKNDSQSSLAGSVTVGIAVACSCMQLCTRRLCRQA